MKAAPSISEGKAPPHSAPAPQPVQTWDFSKRQSKKLRRKEVWIEYALLGSAVLSVLVTLGIVWVLVKESILFFQEVAISDFLFGTKWTPLFEPKSFGVLPLLWGTFLVAFGSALVAVPLGVLTAIFLSEYASQTVRSWVKPVLETLSGIPTVVYGYFALTFITPIIKELFPQTQVFNAASASIVVGIMILPMIASLCDDAMRSVPRNLREGGYAVGATKFEVSLRVVFPAALSGVVASFVLAISRAVGETMAVALAAGSTPKMTWSFLESIQTMTAYIVQVSMGDAPQGTIEYQTLFAVGLTLFLITLTMNMMSTWVLRRFREQYV